MPASLPLLRMARTPNQLRERKAIFELNDLIMEPYGPKVSLLFSSDQIADGKGRKKQETNNNSQPRENIKKERNEEDKK